MSIWRSARAGLRSLLRKDDVERDLDDELRHYLAMATEKNVRKGMGRADAERAALLQMGGLEANKFDVRGGGWEAQVMSVAQDVRVALRGLRHSPAFAVVAISSLALGIGVNTTMFSVMNAVMFRPLPYHDAGRLALIWTNDVRRSIPREPTAWTTIIDWQARGRAFKDLGYFSTERVAPTASEKGRTRSRRAYVSDNLFGVLGVAPLQGRLISPADIRDRAPVAVISYAFWQRWFDGKEDVLGKPVTFEGTGGKDGPAALTVVGVLPQGFYFPDKATDIFTPATTYWRFDRERVERFQDWARRWTAVGRLADGASFSDARADLDAIGRHLAPRNPTTVPDFPGFATTVVPVLETFAGASLQAALWMLLGAVGLVLLVVCANVANLQLARGTSRHREFAVRRALGAARGRIVRQLVVESFVLFVIGGAVGTALAAVTTPLLTNFASGYLPRMDEVALDWRVLTFAAGASLVTGLVFGLVPALRLSSADANEALREGAHGTGSGRVRRSQGVLVLAECTLALILLTGAGLLIRSLNRLNDVNPGFDPRNVMTVRVEFAFEPPPFAASDRSEASQVDQARARARALQMFQLMSRVRELPGVAAVGFTDDMFVAGQGNSSITIPGREGTIAPGELNDGAVSSGFFEAMRVPLRSGRYPAPDDVALKIRAMWTVMPAGVSLADQERLARPEPVVVNDAFVWRFFHGLDPVGKRFCTNCAAKAYWYEIVGVVGDMHRSGLERVAIPEFYGPYIPSANGRADLVVRTQGDPLAMAAMLRSEVQRAVPSIVVVSMATAEQGLDGFSAQRRLQTGLLAVFAALALMLAAVGIFGLAHYSVAERTREIGVRVALGATPGDVIRMVIVQGMRMPALGIVLGLALSAALTRVIANQLYDVPPHDPVTFVGVALVSAGVAGTACYVAARRAVRADPVQALRQA
ncbi:MAG: ADOP family duplicated permease [Gemmatimonadaceae bacterium]